MDSNSIHLGLNEAEGGMSAAGIGSLTTDAFTTAARDHLARQEVTDSYPIILAALTERAREHWTHTEQDRERHNDRGCSCDLCQTLTAAHSDLTVDSEAVTVESDEPTDAELADAAMDALGCELRMFENGASTCDLHGGYATSDDVCEVVDGVLSAVRAALTAARQARP